MSVVPSPLVRLRSMALLTVLLIVLGLLLAVTLVLGGAIVLTGLKNAVQG